MSDYVPFVVIGLTSGAVYALAALGLVLTYKTSGVFNFAHGAVGMFSAYVFYSLRVDVGLPTVVAALVAIVGFAPVMGVAIDRVFLRRLEGAPAATFVVASLGLLVALQGLATLIYGVTPRRVAAIFPTRSFRLPGVNVGADQMLVVAVSLSIGLGLLAFFRFTRLGLLTRAVVSDRSLTDLTGSDPAAITTFSWMLGSALAATSAILFVPFIGLDSILLTLLVVEAFGAAVLGRLRSLSITMAAAFGIAVLQSLATKVVAELQISNLGGIPAAIPFTALFAVLLFARRGSLVEVTTVRKPSRVARSRSGRNPLLVPLGAIAVGALLPYVLESRQLSTATATVAFVLIFSSLSLPVGQARQVSLAHAIFVALGATTTAHLLAAGVPFLLALPLAGLVAVPIGAVLSIPGMRLSGLFLALATFAFGVLAQNLLFATGALFGSDSLAYLPRPSFLAGDRPFYFFALAVAAAGVLTVELVRVTRLGRVLVALGDSPVAVQSLGVNPLVARVLTFCLSAFLAALAGGVLGAQTQAVTPTSFTFFQSLLWVTVLVAAGAYSFGGSLLAAVLLVAIPSVVTSSTVTEWQPIFFGLGAIFLAQAPNGLAGLVRMPDLNGLVERNAWRLESHRATERLLRRPPVTPPAEAA